MNDNDSQDNQGKKTSKHKGNTIRLLLNFKFIHYKPGEWENIFKILKGTIAKGIISNKFEL